MRKLLLIGGLVLLAWWTGGFGIRALIGGLWAGLFGGNPTDLLIKVLGVLWLVGLFTSSGVRTLTLFLLTLGMVRSSHQVEAVAAATMME